MNFGRRAARLRFAHDSGKFEGAIRPNEFLVTPALQPVDWYLRDEADALSIRLQPEFIRNIAETLEMNSDQVELLHKIPVSDRRLVTYGEHLLDELRSRGLGGPLCAESLATQLAVHLLRHYTARPPTSIDRYNDLTDRRFRKSIEFIQDNLYSKVYLKDLAMAAGMSPWHFVRRFKELVGLPPHAYQITQRIERAKLLLRGPNEHSRYRPCPWFLGPKPLPSAFQTACRRHAHTAQRSCSLSSKNVQSEDRQDSPIRSRRKRVQFQ